MAIIVSRQNGYKEAQRLFLSESIMPAAAKQRMSVSKGLVVLGIPQIRVRCYFTVRWPHPARPPSFPGMRKMKAWLQLQCMQQGRVRGQGQAQLLPLGLPAVGVWFSTPCYLLICQSGVWVH